MRGNVHEVGAVDWVERLEDVAVVLSGANRECTQQCVSLYGPTFTLSAKQATAVSRMTLLKSSGPTPSSSSPSGPNRSEYRRKSIAAWKRVSICASVVS